MDVSKIPQHVAIIMDGNGRWAQKRNLPRTQGHIEGVKRVEEIVAYSRKIGIKALTLFAFSTENWKRPESEVTMLMRTLILVLNQKVKDLNSNNICLQFIGKKEGVPSTVLNAFQSAADLTKENTSMILNVAFNYGSRQEILDGVKALAESVKKGEMDVSDINEETFSRSLYTHRLPDPDLLIRTSGEKRISNFLLWQLSYAEFYFTDTFWPDFNEQEFQKALEDYQNRERRYGHISPPLAKHVV